MSTDTESQATETHNEAVSKALDQLRAWADNKNIPWDAVVDAMGDGTQGGDVEEHLPPFHTVLLWTDIFSPTGIKYHLTAREGATANTIVQLLSAAGEALDTLIEQDGWLPADMKPRSREEIDAVREQTAAKVQKVVASGEAAKAAQSVAKAASRAGGDPAESGNSDTRTINVESIFKGVTEKGAIRYTVKGFPWKQYGVICWPDSGHVEKLSGVVNLDAWEVGQAVDFSGVDIQAVVRLKEGEKPDKVIDFTGADALSNGEPD